MQTIPQVFDMPLDLSLKISDTLIQLTILSRHDLIDCAILNSQYSIEGGSDLTEMGLAAKPIEDGKSRTLQEVLHW